MDIKIKKILYTLKEILENKYSSDYSKLYLFGSQIDSYHPDSDCDIMIVFKKAKDWKQIKEIMDLVIDVGIENDIVFNSKIYSENQLETHIYKEVPLIQNILKAGVIIWLITIKKI